MKPIIFAILFGILLPKYQAFGADRLTVTLGLPKCVISGGIFCIELYIVTNPGIDGAAFALELSGAEVARAEGDMGFNVSYIADGERLIVLLDSANAVTAVGTAVRIYCTAERDFTPVLTSADKKGAWRGGADIPIDVIKCGATRTAASDSPLFVGCTAREICNGFYGIYAVAVCRACAEVRFFAEWDGTVSEAISAPERFCGIAACDYGGDILSVAELGLIDVGAEAEIRVFCGEAVINLKLKAGKITPSGC